MAQTLAPSSDMPYLWVMPNTDTEFLSVAQAAAELHIGQRAVRHRIAAGTLAATKLGPGTAQYVIAREEVERAKTSPEAAS